MAKDATDAIALLKADHREVQELFANAEQIPKSTFKQEIVRQICHALTVHVQIEEEVAYPAFRQAGVTSRLMDEASVDRATIKELVEQLRNMNASDDYYDAKVKILSGYLTYHVKEEETKIFQEVEGADVDLEEIGQQLVQRKRELMGELKKRPAA